jgi:hypothetical protein
MAFGVRDGKACLQNKSLWDTKFIGQGKAHGVPECTELHGFCDSLNGAT